MPTLEEIKNQIGDFAAGSKLLGRAEIRELPRILWEDECIEQLVQGTYGTGIGVLVATNKRVIFVDKGFTKLRVEDFPYDKVSSVQYETGIMMGTITIFTSGNRADIKNVEKGACRAFAEYLRARVTAPSEHASAPSAEPTAAAISHDDRIAHLERLAALHQSGALTDDEFEAQKQQILGPA